MSIDRRRLLQFTGAGCALALVAPVAGSASPLRVHRVLDYVARPRFAAGDLVVADTAVTRFAGPGLYLYPAWGQPRLYEVTASVDRLEFRNPGCGQLLWTQSPGLDALFAGRVPELPVALADHPALCVPSLPGQA